MIRQVGAATPQSASAPRVLPVAMRLAGWSDGLLSVEPKRRIRLIQSGVAAAIMLLGLAVLYYAAWAGLADWPPLLVYSVVALCGFAVFFVAIRSRWSERFADPSLTSAQMVFAVVCCAWGYAIGGRVHSAAFPLVLVVLMFGMFSLSPRGVFAISLVAVGAFGSVMAAMCHLRPGVFVPAVEFGCFLMLATMMPTVSLLAARLGKLRARLSLQKHELTVALERIEFLAMHDALTGLVNRRQMTELIHRQHVRALRTGAPFCIALIDLDHFKRINDQYGHAAGDQVLRTFAAESEKIVRATDAFGRWGGEEFVLLMPDATLASAREGAERLRRTLEATAIPVGDAVVTMTLSAGMVQFAGDETPARMIERADAALYRAKAQGRNQVVPA
jgi:diguanylate cyclase (GGDEF)-like protein